MYAVPITVIVFLYHGLGSDCMLWLVIVIHSILRWCTFAWLASYLTTRLQTLL
ncbi:hypothetical protein BD311DRAFT_760620 [Dichomitus squalens]|uniref:Uncharacterized protein n=1 Tax=Dichomitus squalens TaxID=114155 RepID=A0A4Q9MMJ2_9APHY|nr:hypothetical protein BD311DRAFT_760620 [Dichomitus squalens]